MIAITNKAKVGEIDGQEIWKVTGTKVIPYIEKTSHIKEEQVYNLQFSFDSVPVMQEYILRRWNKFKLWVVSH